MHSISHLNTRCLKTSIATADEQQVDSLAPIPQDNVMDGTCGFMEDIEDILKGVCCDSLETVTPTATSTAKEQTNVRPRGCRDLRSLMPEADRPQLFQGSTPRYGLRKRLETYLEEELLLAQLKESEDSLDKRLESNKDNVKEAPKVSESHGDWSTGPIVWVIQPGYNQDGTLHFKITTDSGGCMILKREEALESIEILKASGTPSNTFFQVYVIQGGISKVVSADQVADAINDVISEAKPVVDGEEVLNSQEKTKSKKRLGQRVYRFFLRRRWKNLVRRQVGIAVGDSGRGARLFSMIFPFFMIWKAFQRRSRETV